MSAETWADCPDLHDVPSARNAAYALLIAARNYKLWLSDTGEEPLIIYRQRRSAGDCAPIDDDSMRIVIAMTRAQPPFLRVHEELQTITLPPAELRPVRRIDPTLAGQAALSVAALALPLPPLDQIRREALSQAELIGE